MRDDSVTTTKQATKQAKGSEEHRRQMAKRRARFLELYDFTSGHGLEIGPLDSAISDKSVDDVSYVDIFDNAGLRAHYGDDPNVLVDLIPEVDFPHYVDGTFRDLATAAAPGAPYDWVIASHVIEHVPDFVGWLDQIARLTVDGGALLLAVPDRRRTFDRHRPPTTVGQALEAHELGQTRPGTRALHDFSASVIRLDPKDLVRGQPIPGRDRRVHPTLDEARRQVERGRAGEYVDCHVWLWTPTDFLHQIQELRALGAADWYVETIAPQRRKAGEFLVVLRRSVDGQAPEGLVEPAPDTDLPGWLYDDLAPAHERIEELEKRVRRLKERSDRLQAEVDRLRARHPRALLSRLKARLSRHG
ncbi:methyltransferase domain-containing protein [Nocardioides albidus]|uniref:Methyltransferase domain-containing protein n=1 Tax=Nocardioides albidus TaxID=1517589 RepID=A0A5C4W1X7_9ACTN|nr:methyltransferase domain-containing protein [Nocardioides albidus]TNM42033.1 methyltransferase domain-containing protein [Nocardioides albidus]